MTHSPQGLRFWSGNWRHHCGSPRGLRGGRYAMVGFTLGMLVAVIGCEPAKSDKDSNSGEAVSRLDSTHSEPNAGAISESANQPPDPPKAPVPDPAPIPDDKKKPAEAVSNDPVNGEQPTAPSDIEAEGSAAEKANSEEKAEAVEKLPSGDSQAETKSTETKSAESNPQGAAVARNPSNRFLPPNRNPQAATQGAKPDKETVEDRKAREAAKKRGEITFDDLKFDMEKGAIFKNDMLGTANWELHEKVWKIRGFILPTTLFSQSGITEFVLVRDNQECCFGPGAALYDCIIVKMAPGKTINYTTRVVSVKGKLEIDTESFQYPDDGGHYAVYKMTAEEVK